MFLNELIPVKIYEKFIFNSDTSDAELEDDHRGCSPFIIERENECIAANISTIGYINCRDTCHSDHCNTGKHIKTHQCHSCYAMQDSQGNLIGIGDDRCFGSAE